MVIFTYRLMWCRTFETFVWILYNHADCGRRGGVSLAFVCLFFCTISQKPVHIRWRTGHTNVPQWVLQTHLFWGSRSRVPRRLYYAGPIFWLCCLSVNIDCRNTTAFKIFYCLSLANKTATKRNVCSDEKQLILDFGDGLNHGHAYLHSSCLAGILSPSYR